MELPEWLAAEVAAGKVTKKESRFRGSQGATTRVYSQWLCTCGWTLPDGAGEAVYERHHKTAVAHRTAKTAMTCAVDWAGRVERRRGRRACRRDTVRNTNLVGPAKSCRTGGMRTNYLRSKHLLIYLYAESASPAKPAEFADQRWSWRFEPVTSAPAHQSRCKRGTVAFRPRI